MSRLGKICQVEVRYVKTRLVESGQDWVYQDLVRYVKTRLVVSRLGKIFQD